MHERRADRAVGAHDDERFAALHSRAQVERGDGGGGRVRRGDEGEGVGGIRNAVEPVAVDDDELGGRAGASRVARRTRPDAVAFTQSAHARADGVDHTDEIAAHCHGERQRSTPAAGAHQGVHGIHGDRYGPHARLAGSGLRIGELAPLDDRRVARPREEGSVHGGSHRRLGRG